MASRADRGRQSPTRVTNRAGSRSRHRPDPVPGSHRIDTGTVDLSRQSGPPEHWLLAVNGVPSSTLCPDDPTWLGFEYLAIMRLIIDAALPEKPLSALHLGAAGCSLPWALAVGRSGSRQVAVDLDARLLTLVRDWFPLPRSPELRLRPGDAVQEVTRFAGQELDVVVRDVFSQDQTPRALTTQAFLSDVARCLDADGVYLANIADRPPLHQVWDEVVTAATVFPQVALIAETSVLRGRRYGNSVLVGSRRELPLPALQRSLGQLGLSLRVTHGDRLLTAAHSGRVRT